MFSSDSERLPRFSSTTLSTRSASALSFSASRGSSVLRVSENSRKLAMVASTSSRLAATMARVSAVSWRMFSTISSSRRCPSAPPRVVRSDAVTAWTSSADVVGGLEDLVEGERARCPSRTVPGGSGGFGEGTGIQLDVLVAEHAEAGDRARAPWWSCNLRVEGQRHQGAVAVQGDLLDDPDAHAGDPDRALFVETGDRREHGLHRAGGRACCRCGISSILMMKTPEDDQGDEHERSQLGRWGSSDLLLERLPGEEALNVGVGEGAKLVRARRSARMRPSRSMAIRSAMRNAEFMSWVMVTMVTGRCSRMSMMTRSMTAEVIGSRPVLGSSNSRISRREGDRAREADAAPHAAGELVGRLSLDSRRDGPGRGTRAPAPRSAPRSSWCAAGGERRCSRRRSSSRTGRPPGTTCRTCGVCQGTCGLGAGDVLAVDDDVAAVGLDQADQVLEQDALAGARSADDDERLARATTSRLDAAQHFLAVERLPQVDHRDLGADRRAAGCRSGVGVAVSASCFPPSLPPRTGSW